MSAMGAQAWNPGGAGGRSPCRRHVPSITGAREFVVDQELSNNPWDARRLVAKIRARML